MKKIYSILMLAMMAMCVFTLSSCGDDDNEFSSKSVIGTWRWTDPEDEGDWLQYTFKKDNTFIYREHEDGEEDYVEHGTYTLDIHAGRNRAILVWEDEEKETFYFTINGKELIVDDGYGYIFVLQYQGK